mmetsp:Transcript_59122/g.125334  ORF Transcript_59122/g.125334 Transcript_59122/m.125334 type:complete len:321 (-) Transcript_59122:838-1800(-)
MASQTRPCLSSRMPPWSLWRDGNHRTWRLWEDRAGSTGKGLGEGPELPAVARSKHGSDEHLQCPEVTPTGGIQRPSPIGRPRPLLALSRSGAAPRLCRPNWADGPRGQRRRRWLRGRLRRGGDPWLGRRQGFDQGPAQACGALLDAHRHAPKGRGGAGFTEDPNVGATFGDGCDGPGLQPRSRCGHGGEGRAAHQAQPLRRGLHRCHRWLHPLPTAWCRLHDFASHPTFQCIFSKPRRAGIGCNPPNSRALHGTSPRWQRAKSLGALCGGPKERPQRWKGPDVLRRVPNEGRNGGLESRRYRGVYEAPIIAKSIRTGTFR